MAARELMILLAPDSSAWGICAPSSLEWKCPPRNEPQLLNPLCGLRGCGESVWEAVQDLLLLAEALGEMSLSCMFSLRFQSWIDH